MNARMKLLLVFAILLVVFASSGIVWKRPSVNAWKAASLDKLKQVWYQVEEIDWSKDLAQIDADFVRLKNGVLKADPLTKEPFVILPRISEVMKMPPEKRNRIPIIVSKYSQKAKGHTVLYADGNVQFVIDETNE